MKLLLQTFLSLLILVNHMAYAQIGINGSAHPSAALDVKSPNNDKAFYPPRLTTAQRNAITNPQAGAFVYDLDKGAMYLHDGQGWLRLATADLNAIIPSGRTASDGLQNDLFGWDVSISGDYAIVSAVGKAIGSKAYQGAAYIFKRSGNTWTEHQRLISSDGTAYDSFGSSVIISGDYAVVGATNKTIDGSNYPGAAYVFVRSGTSWIEQQRLMSTDGVSGDAFGRSVAISGDNIVIGAHNKVIAGKSNQGAAYVFTRIGGTWTQQQRLTAGDGAVDDYFGSSVAISGDYIVIGSYFKTVSGGLTAQGAAYVFSRSNAIWSEQQRLTANDAASYDNFGIDVAVLGDYAFIGASFKTVGGTTGQGVVYIFNRSGNVWSQQQRLAALDGAIGDRFGYSLSASGDYLLIGANGKTIGGNQYQGAAYVFRKSGSTWIQLNRIVDDLPVANSLNGSVVGLSGGYIIIGGYGFQNQKGKVLFSSVE